MAVVLLLLVIISSYVCVRIGAIALELTGTPWEAAKFQALSAFSTTGFTSQEAESVVRHPVRRRIITYLMVLGNAGIVTTIGTFAGSLAGSDLRSALRNVGVITVSMLFFVWVARREIVSTRFRSVAKRWLARRYEFTPTTDALLHFDEGYCLTRIVVPADSPTAGRRLADLDLKGQMVQVLAIERSGEFLPIPDGDTRLEEGDSLVVYGTEESVDYVFKPERWQRLSILVDYFRNEGAPPSVKSPTTPDRTP